MRVTALCDGEFTNDFDLSNYIQQQDGWTMLESSSLPEGTEILKMDDYHKIPVSVMRDTKIDKVIENKVLTTINLRQLMLLKITL